MLRLKSQRILSLLLCLLMGLSLVACQAPPAEKAKEEKSESQTEAAKEEKTEAESKETAESKENATEKADETKAEEPKTGAAERKDKVVIGVANDITTLDPQGSNTDANMMAFILTHETLVEVDPETNALIPGMAEKWEVSDDGCTFIFEIPADVKFSDGSLCTANDLVFTFNRAKESSFTKTKVELVKEVEAVDDTHFKVVITKPSQDFLLLLAHQSMSILSEKLVKEDELGYKVGTGPYMVQEWIPGDQISFVRNEYYHKGKTPTETIVYRLIKEESSRLISLQTEQIDICLDPLSTDLKHIEEDENLELVKIPNYVLLYLAINNERKGLDDVHVRKAIAYASDKESMIEVGYNGEGFVHDHWVNRNQMGWFDELEIYPFDMEKAKEEFSKSAYKPGELKFRLIYNGSAKENVGLVLQSNLAQLGIEIELIKLETAALKGILNDAALDYDLCLYQFTDNLGTDFTLRNQFGSFEEDGKLVKNGSNRANMKDPKYNAMIDEALVELDPAKREKMYNDIEVYLNDIVPIVPIATTYINVGIQKGLTGVKWNGTAKHDFRQVAVPKK